MDISGKVAVVTGAASGIGRALAQELAKAGARLAISDINEAGLAETLKLLPAGTDAKGYRLDVTDNDAFIAHASDVLRDFGAAHLLVNNAGATLIGSIEQSTIAEMRWQIDVNLWSVIYGTKAFLPILRAQPEAHIVNISSIFGIIAFPGQGAYNVSKFGVRGFTECLAIELDGSGIGVTCVHPGGIRTNIEKAGRLVANAGPDAEKIAAAAAKSLRTPPEVVARDILKAVRHGKRRLLTGYGARAIDLIQRLTPTRYAATLKTLFGG